MIKTIKNKYPGILFVPRPPSLRFAPDRVHLVDKSSHTMFKVVKEECEDFFFRLCKEEDICDDEQKPNKQEQSDQEEEKSSRISKNKTQKLQ